MNKPNYKCPNCNGRLQAKQPNLFNCTKCGRDWQEAVEHVAKSDFESSTWAKALLEES